MAKSMNRRAFEGFLNEKAKLTKTQPALVDRIKHLEERVAAFEESERKLVRELAEANTINGKKTGEIAMLQEKYEKLVLENDSRITVNRALRIDLEMNKITYQNMRSRMIELQNHIDRLNRLGQ